MVTEINMPVPRLLEGVETVEGFGYGSFLMVVAVVAYDGSMGIVAKR